MVVYTKVGEVKIERLDSHSVRFICPEGHHTIKRFRKTHTTEKEIDLRVQFWRENTIEFTCHQCGSLFSQLSEMVSPF